MNDRNARAPLYQAFQATASGWSPVGAPGAIGASAAPMTAPVGLANPSTIFNRMDEIDAAAKATNAAVATNLVPTSDYVAIWNDWYAQWQSFNDHEHSLSNLLAPAAWLLRSGELEREIEARAGQLDQLRAQYATQKSKTGGAPAPIVGPSVPKLPSGGPTDYTALARNVAIGAGVILGGVLLLVYAPEIKAVFAAGRRR